MATVEALGSGDDIPDSFLELPFALYKDEPNWSPRPPSETVRLLSLSANPYWRKAERKLFVAVEGGRVIGRIVATNDPDFALSHKCDVGFFGFFECVDDADTARKLFEAAGEWLSSRGRSLVRGPFNPYPENPGFGVMAEGFSLPQSFGEPFNPPFYLRLFESCGFRKLADFSAYSHSFSDNPVWERIMARLRRRLRNIPSLRVRSFSHEDFDRDAEIARGILNETYAGDPVFTTWDSDVQRFIIRTFVRPGNERLSQIIESDGEPAGICLIAPDYDEAIMSRRMPETPIVDGSGRIKGACAAEFCISPRFRHTPAVAALFFASWEILEKEGFRCTEISFEQEDNHAIHSMLASSGAVRTKCFRLYERDLREGLRREA